MSNPADRLVALASHLLRDEREDNEITLEIDAGLSVLHAAGAISSGICPRESLKGKTLVITGASRGIGLAIALAAAREGANIAILAKTAEPHPKLPGTIHTAAADIEAAGGKALAITCDVRSEADVEAAVKQTVDLFGGIDILVNNASAIHLTTTPDTPMKKYDLMHQVNGRGTFLCTQKCLPFLRRGRNPHILNISPPLSMSAKWFRGHAAYTGAKYLMSMYALGMAEEFREDGIAVNTLWPRTSIATAAVEMLSGDEGMRKSRTVGIMADAATVILKSPSTKCTANFFIDDEVLAAVGVKDLSVYNVDPTVPQSELILDFFLPDA